MRKLSTLIASAAALGLTLSVLPVGAATAAKRVDERLFGQHIAGIAGGAPTGTLPSVGSIRLWDSAVSWRNIRRPRAAPDFTALDAADSGTSR